MQISEHSLKGAYPSVDWGPIHDIHTLDGVSPNSPTPLQILPIELYIYVKVVS